LNIARCFKRCADRDVTITAADLVSGGNLSIKAGRDLSLLSQAQVEHTLTARRQSFVGFKLEVSQNVTSAIDTLKSAGHTFNSGYGGDGYRAIGAISGALKTVDAVSELTHPSVSASLTVGASNSRSRSERYQETARPTTIRAAGDVSLGAGRDLHLQGPQVDAGGWLALGAGRDVLIESARSRSAASQSSSSQRAGVGVGATVGLSGPSVGPKVEGSASQSRSQEQGETNTNAHLNAGQGISVGSGRDTTIAGARLTAPEIDLKVGRDLTVASRQDTSQGRSRSSSGGGSLTVGKDSPSSGSLSIGQGRGSSDRAWVGEQTGIVAGDRLSVTVGGHTWIHGAVLDSGTGNLSLDTGSLTVTDVHNHDRGRSFQATVGVSGSRNPDGSTPATGPDGKPVGGTVSGSFASHDKQGLSRGTIGAGTITVRDPSHQSQDLAAINRDPKQAEVVTRDRKAGVDFYGSSSSLKEIGSGFAGTRQGLDQLGKAARDGFTNLPARVQATVMDVAGKLDLTGRTLRGAVDAVIDALVAEGEIPTDEAEKAKQDALRAILNNAQYTSLTSGAAKGSSALAAAVAGLIAKWWGDIHNSDNAEGSPSSRRNSNPNDPNLSFPDPENLDLHKLVLAQILAGGVLILGFYIRSDARNDVFAVTNNVDVSGKRPTDRGHDYEQSVRDMYGASNLGPRDFEVYENGEIIRRRANGTTIIDGSVTTIESNYVDD